jgi:hypothetical protein
MQELQQPGYRRAYRSLHKRFKISSDNLHTMEPNLMTDDFIQNDFLIQTNGCENLQNDTDMFSASMQWYVVVPLFLYNIKICHRAKR